MDDLTITWCGPEAAATVHALTQAAFEPYATLNPPSKALDETEELVRRELSTAPGAMGTLGDDPVVVLRTIRTPGAWVVRRVGVTPGLQHQGLGRQLMGWVASEACAAGIGELRVGVRHQLPRNRALFCALGYEEVADHSYWTEFRLDLR
jgi:GNAT superfamily N-acetyltransferase